ncbi:MAG: S9 family peptidase [Solirubrobacteraceae bacterium]
MTFRPGRFPEAAYTPESVAGGVERTEVSATADGVYWLEHDYEEGRSCVMHAPTGRLPRALTPEGVDVGSLAWEYGGGSYLMAEGAVVYADRDDQRLYRREPGRTPLALSPEPSVPLGDRYADGSLSSSARWAVYVRESHGADGSVRHALVAVDLKRLAPPRTLIEGHDFYAWPRVSPDGRRLAWICWNKPNMPWDGTELWVAELERGGNGAGDPRRIAGGPTESVVNPAWSPDGALHWVSDRSGWWNLYALRDGGARALAPERAEYAAPAWQHGRRSYGFLADGTIVTVRIRDAVHELVRITARGSSVATVGPEITWIVGPHVSCFGRTVALAAATPTAEPAVLTVDVPSGTVTTVVADEPAASEVSVGTGRWFRARDGSEVHGFLYEPANNSGQRRSRSPLMLNLHGGPTDSARQFLDPELQLWIANGFALLDLNYSGSSGFGSSYRHRLDGEWGRRDLDDCVAAVRHLVAEGIAPADRVLVRGASAGGYLTLRCLTATTTFEAGMCRCGIADLALWREHTHDFESRYTDRLVGPPTDADLYGQRSPVRSVATDTAPALLVHGLADTVVPPEHAHAVARAYQSAGRPYRLELLDDEPHSLRRRTNRLRWLEAELQFYRKLLLVGR